MPPRFYKMDEEMLEVLDDIVLAQLVRERENEPEIEVDLNEL